MFLKYIVLGLIIYTVYRFFIQPSLKAPEEPRREEPRDTLHIHKDEEADEDDYIDYEEIE